MARMRFLMLSPQTYRRFEEFARADSDALGRTFRSNARYDPATDQWAVPLSEDVASRLEGRRGPGQSDDELLDEVLTVQCTSTNVRQ